MKIKIPSSYTIAGIKHEVQMTKNLSANEAKRGTATYFERVCRIDPDLAIDEQRRTLVHEALHHIDDIFDTDLKETAIRRLSIGMAELIQQLEGDK